MINVIRSERLKYKRTSIKKMLVIIPFAAAFIGIMLMGPVYAQYFSYNVWTTMFLPFLIGLISSSFIAKEKKHLYHGLFVVIEDKKQLWLAKNIYGIVLVLTSSIIMSVIGIIFYVNSGNLGISIIQNIIAMLVLTVCYAWQVPFFMFLSRKINYIVTILICVIVNMVCQIAFAMKLWWIPFAIPSRLMCPILGMYPNGVMIADMSDPYLSTDKILPGMIICILLFVLTLVLTSKSFEKEQV